jgi:hypothetical protein
MQSLQLRWFASAVGTHSGIVDLPPVHAFRNDHFSFHHVQTYRAFCLDIIAKTSKDTFSEDIPVTLSTVLFRETFNHGVNIHIFVRRGDNVIIGGKDQLWMEHCTPEASEC